MDTSPAMPLTLAADQRPDDFPLPAAGEPVCTIGELAKQFGLTLRALRFYESRGLLKPMRRGRNRVYGPRQVERLAAIVKAKKLGLTLNAIRQTIGEEGSAPSLRLSRETCEAQIAALERNLAQTQEALAELRAICAAFADPRPDRR